MVYQLSQVAESVRAGALDLDAATLLWDSPPVVRPGPDLVKKPRGRQLPTLRQLPRMDEPEAQGPALVLVVAKAEGKTTPLGRGVTVGRMEANDIVLDDPSVSRFHAWLEAVPAGGWALVDAGSEFGTWVRRDRLAPRTPTALAENTQIVFGKVEVVFLTVRALLQRRAQK